MTITTHRVKQYNSTCKTVVCVNNKPICIVSGNGKTLSNIISYLSGYKTEIADGQVKKVLDAVLKSEKCTRSKITEVDVKNMIELKTKGLSNKKIAEQIGCSEQTIANYLAKQPAWLL